MSNSPAAGIELEPQRATVDELVQRRGRGETYRLLVGDRGGDHAAVPGDIGGDQPHFGLSPTSTAPTDTSVTVVQRCQ